MLGATAGTLRLPNVAERYFEIARRGAEKADTLDADFVQKWMQGMHHINHTEFSRAEELVGKVLERCRASQDSRGIVNSLQVLAIGAYFEGELDRSLELASEAKQVAGANAYRVLETVARCHMASVYLSDERHGRALPLLAARSSGEDEGALNTINLHAILAGAFLRSGQLEQAIESANQTRALLEAHPSGNMFAYPAHFWLPMVYLEAWRSLPEASRREEMASNAQETIAWVRRFARLYPVGRPLALRHRAEALAMSGREAAAETMRAKALAEANRLGMSYEAELVRRALPSSR
jgi:hypothetical protein